MDEGRRKASRVRASSVALFKGSAGRGTAAVRVFIIRLLRCCACAMAALAARSLAHGSRPTDRMQNADPNPPQVLPRSQPRIHPRRRVRPE